MSSNPSVVVRDLSKTYFVNKEGSERGLKFFGKRTAVEALKPMSAVFYEGESIGVLGRNGSGKSTFLSMIAGNEKPTTGEILVSGQPSLLSVGAALQPHLSGLENVRLGLLAKGFSKAEAESMMEEVADWADIGDAVHRPISTYSSGMGARLKFSIATATRPDILLVDEALSTGDNAFNAKAQARMDSFLTGASTVFIVSHGTQTIQKHCSRAIWIHEGELIADRPAADTVKWYNMWTKEAAAGDRFAAAKLIRRVKNDFEPQRIVLNSEVSKLFGTTPDSL